MKPETTKRKPHNANINTTILNVNFILCSKHFFLHSFHIPLPAEEITFREKYRLTDQATKFKFTGISTWNSNFDVMLICQDGYSSN